ncbi:MAG: DUF3883 domain-containing protein [Deltaproteobacteria bacterium]|jgi:superfamily II DNA or RNA helicase|nr:DUF3883 domain-containing protein [Deltaproteobacteria bacterium]
MPILNDIKVGSRVKGLWGQDAVSVVSLIPRGPGCLEVIYKNDQGALGTRLLTREDETTLEIVAKGLPFSFAADPDQFKLASEGFRIRLAHLFDPYLSVYSSDIEPLPHQIMAVYQDMLPKRPLKFVLADDPGAGKTIMTGLLIKELMIRGEVKRCLIVTPGSLVEQWQEELYTKFHLKFEILTSERLNSTVTSNPFTDIDLALARLDTLSRNDQLKDKLKASDWDLIVCDEAHKMSATFWGGEIKYTKRFHLGRLLSHITRNFLLLTATPHNGKESDFQLFLSLVDEDSFECSPRTNYQPVDVSNVMRRMVKEDLLRFDGTPLFPERLAYTVKYALAPGEAQLYEEVTEYVRAEFNRANRLTGDKKTAVGFALISLQRRLASSPEAIYQSLIRRRERLKSRLELEKNGLTLTVSIYDKYSARLEDDDDWPTGESEELEQRITDEASAAKTVKELEAEIATLGRLEELAKKVRHSGEDRKWNELVGLIERNRLIVKPNGERQKLIIFTEHRDTLNYLTEKIRDLLANDKAVVNIHGGLSREERRKVEWLFKQDKEAYILVATDAAGEGINLQRAHLMVNYDLPWNPNRLEQRFGRIHRIGQMEVCHLWNLVASETREGLVFGVLFAKLEVAREALGGKVFDVLGRLTFEDKSLKDLLIDAIRYNNDAEVRERIYQVVDTATDQTRILELLRREVLTEDVMNFRVLTEVKETMERVEAHKMQPHFIESFFLKAFKTLGGKIHPREKNRFEISHTPKAVRERDPMVRGGANILSSYERVCFDKNDRKIRDLPEAEFLCPGHPLLDAVVAAILEKSHDVLKQGSILVDPNDPGQEARILFFLESSIQDNLLTATGSQRVISRRVEYVELDAQKEAKSGGVAPYLNYRPPSKDEEALIRERLKGQSWLSTDIEDVALAYASQELIPAHLEEVKSRKKRIIEKTMVQVDRRLAHEIRYWYQEASELKLLEETGKVNAKINSKKAQKWANELEDRLNRRLSELKKESEISALPPILVGGALVAPLGLVQSLLGQTAQETPLEFGGLDRKAAEMAAMARVMAIEKSLGYFPTDVSAHKFGYDIESKVPLESRSGGSALRFLEVKGRVKGATTVTVTRTETLTALNKRADYILALVELDEDRQDVWYVKDPMLNGREFGRIIANLDLEVVSINLDIAKLKAMADQSFLA